MFRESFINLNLSGGFNPCLWLDLIDFRSSLYKLDVKEVKEMATYLKEDGAGQDEVKKEKMSS